MAPMSVYWDGKISIEHQISIHVKDLIQSGSSNRQLTSEILTGLQYVLDYRLRGRKQYTLDSTVCEQLVRTLLLYTGERQKRRGIFRLSECRVPSNQADYVFALLADFCNEVKECSDMIQGFNGFELAERLLFYQRILKPSSQNIHDAALSLLHCVSATQDWREFFHQDDLEEIDHHLHSVQFFAPSNDIMATNSISGPPRKIFPPSALYFDKRPSRVLDMFDIDANVGLEEHRLEELRSHYGTNTLPRPAERSIFRMLLAQIQEFMVIILIATSIVSAIIDYPKLELAMIQILVVILNVSVGFWQEFKSTQTVAAMNSLQIQLARVKRSGAVIQVPAAELVPGDLIVLSEGDWVPADLRLIECNRLEISEAILTGESLGVFKSSAAIRIPSRKLPITKCVGNALMGTMVIRGTGTGIVVRTGKHTEIGAIGSALSLATGAGSTAKSPLQRRIHALSRLLVAIALILCLVVLVIGLAQGRTLEEMSRLSISLAVSVIPEGLVAILTVSMTLAVRRLAKHHILVRRLNIVETLGSATVIAADKTGTLTEGKMRLEHVWTIVDANDDRSMLAESCVLCNNATSNGTGEPTDVAILQGFQQQQPSDTCRAVSEAKRKAEIPFDSDRRVMSVLVERNNEICLHVKGALEAILSRTTSLMINGDKVVLTPDHLEEIINQENQFSDGGLRVLAVARKRMEPHFVFDSEDRQTDLEQDLCFVGLVGLVDPPRPGVAESVRKCHQAGIKVVMITGDNVRTAISIGRSLGIYDASNVTKARVMKGVDVDMLTVESLASLNPIPSVFARVSPSNKLTIVKALKLRGEIVAMTGDGVNDAPAISQADIGIAMGQGGTQITREAASLVLLDDNFTVIVKAIAQGRLMTQNISLFIIYLLSCNAAEIWTVLGAMALSWASPLTSMGILWANIIADIPPSMSLCLEKECEDRLMAMHCRDVPKTLIGKPMWILVAVNGFVLGGLTILAFGIRPRSDSLAMRRSESFLVLVGLQLVLALLSRSKHKSVFQTGIFGNISLLVSVLFSFGCLVVSLYTPWLASVLELEAVSWWGWVRFVTAAVILLACNEVAKLIIRRCILCSPSDVCPLKS